MITKFDILIKIIFYVILNYITPIYMTLISKVTGVLEIIPRVLYF